MVLCVTDIRRRANAPQAVPSAPWRGMDWIAGSQVKGNVVQELDEWLEDDANMEKWESNTFTAGDRRILLATWCEPSPWATVDTRHRTPRPGACLSRSTGAFIKAYKRACPGSAVRKYFEHSGAMMMDDGSADDLIKFERVPKGQKFTF